MKSKFSVLTCFILITFIYSPVGLAQLGEGDPFGGGLPGLGMSCEQQQVENFFQCDSRVSAAFNRWQNSGNSNSICITQCSDVANPDRCDQRCEADCVSNFPPGSNAQDRANCINACQSGCPILLINDPTACPQNCSEATHNRYLSALDCYNNIPGCQPQLDVCGFARWQRDMCLIQFPIDPSNPLINAEERMDCLLASGIDMCE